jgi:dienelactone hydrolase
VGAAVLWAAFLVPASPFWGKLEPGSHGVGFEQIEAYDYSRPFRRGGSLGPRPIVMSIWYPATASDAGAPVELGRYAGGDGLGELADRMRAYRTPLSPEELALLASTPTAAVESASRADGPFPLLVFGTGLSAPSYLSSVLCEYLASHGYVAVAIPSLPYRSDVEADYDLFAVDAQMRDMEFVIQRMHDYPEVGIDRIGLVAWSLGGVTQALLSMKNESVRAVVSLDAATGYAYGQKLVETSIYYDPERATAAFFHATNSRESDAVEKSFRYFDEIVRGYSVLALIEGATHAEFTSLGGVVGHTVRPNESTPEVFRRYHLLCLYVRVFLDATIREDADASSFLRDAPTRHGLEGIVLSRKR